MTVTKYHACCDECFKRIAKISTTHAKSWLDLSNLTDPQGFIAFYEEPFYLNLLENMGLLTSIEKENLIIVKMNGDFNDGVGMFCGENHE